MFAKIITEWKMVEARGTFIPGVGFKMDAPQAAPPGKMTGDDRFRTARSEAPKVKPAPLGHVKDVEIAAATPVNPLPGVKKLPGGTSPKLTQKHLGKDYSKVDDKESVSEGYRVKGIKFPIRRA